MSAPTPPSRPPVALLTAVAFISAAVMGFEVALTRVFAVLLRYHFAFLIISIALCGLGLGGYLAHWWRRRRPLSLPLVAACFGLAVDIALLLVLRVIFAHVPQAYWLAALVVLAPFTLAGMFLAECFATYSEWSGRLYAWDLAGAAVAALAIVGLLQLISAINACLLMGVLAAATAFLLPASSRRSSTVAVGALTALTIAAFLVNPATRWWDIPPIRMQVNPEIGEITQPLFDELSGGGLLPGESVPKIVETRWNAFARTDVVAEQSQPGMFYVYTNGNVPTNMLLWDGRVSTIARNLADFPLNDWAFASANLGTKDKRHGRVLAIGPGGGLDALLALYHGAEQFDGAEINPSIVGLMHDYRQFNGGIYERADVHVVTAEGRAYVRDAVAHGRRYQLLYSALTKTATAGQGMALLESYIYTQDAAQDYLDVLSDDGQFVIVVDNIALANRFLATGLAALRARGVAARDAMRHMAIVFNPNPGPYRFAIVVRKSPFSPADCDRLMSLALKHHLDALWIPDQAEEDEYKLLGSGEWDFDKFVAYFRSGNFHMNIAPCPDDRPFVLDLSLGRPPYALQLTVFTLAMAIILALLGWWDSRGRTSGTPPDKAQIGRDALFMLYFLALGIGFMLVEIPLSQKLILPLGYPTLALTVILFSILLGGGAGAWASQRMAGAALVRWTAGCAFAVAVYTVLLVALLNALQNAMLMMGLPQRCIVTGLVLLPLGFLLGTPFPSGMRLFAERRADLVPLVWGMNGVASVVGSLCAAMGARAGGFIAVLHAGAATYVIAALLVLVMASRRGDSEVASDAPATP